MGMNIKISIDFCNQQTSSTYTIPISVSIPSPIEQGVPSKKRPILPRDPLIHTARRSASEALLYDTDPILTAKVWAHVEDDPISYDTFLKHLAAVPPHPPGDVELNDSETNSCTTPPKPLPDLLYYSIIDTADTDEECVAGLPLPPPLQIASQREDSVPKPLQSRVSPIDLEFFCEESLAFFSNNEQEIQEKKKQRLFDSLDFDFDPDLFS